MKSIKILFASLLLTAQWSFGQEAKQQLLDSIFDRLPAAEREKITVIVSPDKPQDCPPIYTNSFFNTNLFSDAERTLVAGIIKQFKNAATNSAPAGTVFKGWLPMKIIQPRLIEDTTSVSQVALYIETNSNAKVQVASFFENKMALARFRDVSNNGYDLFLYSGNVTIIQQYKNDVVDGLFLGLHDPDQRILDSTKFLSLLRLHKGKAVGKYFGWQADGKIGLELEFKKPFDFLKYQPARYDFLWIENASK